MEQMNSSEKPSVDNNNEESIIESSESSEVAFEEINDETLREQLMTDLHKPDNSDGFGGVENL